MNRLGWTILSLLVLGAILIATLYQEGEAIRRDDSAPVAGPEAVAGAAGDVSTATVMPSGLVIPVLGTEPETLTPSFDQARGGGTRVHRAIDIMAPHGTPVIAAMPGRIERLFTSDAGGLTAYVRSDDGRWIAYYAHLQGYARGLREGMRVPRGGLIGAVGSTGNAEPGAPHLHFALNRMAPGERWHEGTPVDPYPLLAAPPVAR